MMLKDTIIAYLAGFALCAAACPPCLPLLHRLKFGQYIRDEGPQSHKVKSGTPTMGGITFILATLIAALPFFTKYPMIVPVMLFMAAYGCIGFADDYLKIVKKRNEGLKVKEKLAVQIVVTAVLAVYLYIHPEIGSDMLIPFTGDMETGSYLSLGILYIPAVFIIVLGTDNGVNLTDGLDGLCSSVTIGVAVFFAAVAVMEDIPVAPAAGAIAGALSAFLMFNAYPAKMFMGDTGSLALGGFVAAYALVTRLPLFILVAGFVYFFEALSVIMQVTYFKATHGKRIFKMSPIHHHFELCGWSETRIVTVFTAVTVVLSLLAYLGMM